MRRLLFHIARLIIKHYANKNYLKEMEQDLTMHIDSKVQPIYDLLIKETKPKIPEKIKWTRYSEHYLMQYVHEGMHFRLADLLYKLEKFRLPGTEQEVDRYIFDFDRFYKKSIYAILSDILLCLQMKKRGLAKYLKEKTNLAGVDSIDTICNNL